MAREVFLLIAVVAVVSTWYNNIQFMNKHQEETPGTPFFDWDYIYKATAEATVAPFNAVFNNEILVGLPVYAILWKTEAGRTGFKHAWLFLFLSYSIAICVTVPIGFYLILGPRPRVSTVDPVRAPFPFWATLVAVCGIEAAASGVVHWAGNLALYVPAFQALIAGFPLVYYFSPYAIGDGKSSEWNTRDLIRIAALYGITAGYGVYVVVESRAPFATALVDGSLTWAAVRDAVTVTHMRMSLAWDSVILVLATVLYVWMASRAAPLAARIAWAVAITVMFPVTFPLYLLVQISNTVATSAASHDKLT